MRRLLIVLNILASVSVIALGVRLILAPLAVKALWGEEYKVAMFACDNVMRTHLIAKHRVLSTPNDQTVAALEAAELGLLTCQDYDKLRKSMLSLGVAENDLALLGLEAIEEHAEDVRRVVEIHEFRY